MSTSTKFVVSVSWHGFRLMCVALHTNAPVCFFFNHQSQDFSEFFCLFLGAVCLVSDQSTDNHEEVLQSESFAHHSQALTKKNRSVVQ